MTYATQQDLIDRFGLDELIQRTDRDGTGVVNSAVVDRALADADATIDAYIGGRYKLPLSVVPRILTAQAALIARANLYDDHAPEHVDKDRDRAVRFLEMVAQGKVQLGLDAAEAEAQTVDTAQMTSAGSVFSRDNAKDFI